jgi:Flp pilus assembly protein TadB
MGNRHEEGNGETRDMANTLRDGVRDIADQASPRELDAKLEEAMQNKPLLVHLLSMRVVFLAAAIAAAVALIFYLLFSPMLAGVGLVLAFFVAWFGLAVREHENARPAAVQRTGDEDEDEDEKS